MISVGALHPRLVLEDDAIVGVDMVSSRPRGLAARVVGADVDDAARRLSLLFALCGMAHGTALRLAAGADPSGRTDDLLLEQAEAGAWRFGLDAPALVGVAPDATGVAALRRAAGAVRAAGPADRPQAIHALDAVLRALLARDGLEGALMARAERLDRRGLGRHDLPRLTRGRWAALAAGLARPGFDARPTLDGRPAEVGPVEADGAPATLPDRIAGSIAALRAIPARLRAGRGAETSRVAIGPGLGAAIVETARGPLAYRVEVRAGRIAALAAVAPTEWNFHPDGPFARAILGPLGGEDARETARFVAFSFDPCVPVAAAVARDAARETVDA